MTETSTERRPRQMRCDYWMGGTALLAIHCCPNTTWTPNVLRAV